jgi:hypothetical protein
MVKNRVLPFLTVVAMLSFAGLFLACALAGDVPRITKEDLIKMLGAADLVIVDVRVDKDWTSSDSKIRGAVRENPKDIDSWAKKYPKDKTLVFYCA